MVDWCMYVQTLHQSKRHKAGEQNRLWQRNQKDGPALDPRARRHSVGPLTLPPPSELSPSGSKEGLLCHCSQSQASSRPERRRIFPVARPQVPTSHFPLPSSAVEDMPRATESRETAKSPSEEPGCRSCRSFCRGKTRFRLHGSVSSPPGRPWQPWQPWPVWPVVAPK